MNDSSFWDSSDFKRFVELTSFPPISISTGFKLEHRQHHGDGFCFKLGEWIA